MYRIWIWNGPGIDFDALGVLGVADEGPDRAKGLFRRSAHQVAVIVRTWVGNYTNACEWQTGYLLAH